MHSLNRRQVLALSAGIVLADRVWPAPAAEPPKIIVPWPAGGAYDGSARVLAEGLTLLRGQTMIVDNRPGANGALGTMIAARASSSGNVLLYGTADTHTIAPLVNPRLKYSATEDFIPLALAGTMPGILVCRSESPFTDARELIAHARKHPGEVTFASWGVGSVAHVLMAMLEQSAGVEFLHVPFVGVSPAMAQLLGNQIDLAIIAAPAAIANAQSKRLRMLGMGSMNRSDFIPSLATLDEQGFQGFDAETWTGFFLPKAASPDTRRRLHADINLVLSEEQVQRKLMAQGLIPKPLSSQDFSAFLERQRSRWGSVVRSRGIRVNLDS